MVKAPGKFCSHHKVLPVPLAPKRKKLEEGDLKNRCIYDIIEVLSEKFETKVGKK